MRKRRDQITYTDAAKLREDIAYTRFWRVIGYFWYGDAFVVDWEETA